MKNKIITFILLAIVLGVLQTGRVSSQTITVGNITANPGDNILVPINFTNMNDLGAITLFIFYDPAVLTFSGITNIVSQGAGTLANAIPNPQRVGIIWAASTQGVNFPDGKYLDMQFTFLGGSTTLEFSNSCEVLNWDGLPINVNYVDGGASAPAVTFNLTVLLEGAYIPGSGGSMSTNLLNSGLLPLGQPYNPSLPYYGNSNPAWLYSGTENVTSFPSNTVDWVIVELRDAATASQANSTTIVARKTCLLMSNGSIRELNGSSIPSFYTSFTQGAFVVIWHRNHLGIMSANPVAGSGGSYTYNFTTGANQVYGGSAAYKMLETETNVWGMASGDINGDKTINNIDKTSGWMVEAAKKGYNGPDTDLNGQVNNLDKNDYILNNTEKISAIPN